MCTEPLFSDPDSESGSGSTDPIESGSNPDPDPQPWFKQVLKEDFYLSTDNAVAAIEVARVHVHGAALAAHTPGLLAGELGEHAHNRHAHHVRESVRPVRGDHRVLVPGTK